jgi:exodeoxyribonuclease VII small subunit
MKANLTFELAFKELEEISNEIREETVSIDKLAAKVKRANELIQYCKEKLRNTEVEVNKIIGEMDNK